MVYKVNLSKKAKKEFGVLPKATKSRVADALREVRDFPDRTAKAYKLHKPLTGFKRRVGKYRILFDIKDNEIMVRHIGLRSSAYKK